MERLGKFGDSAGNDSSLAGVCMPLKGVGGYRSVGLARHFSLGFTLLELLVVLVIVGLLVGIVAPNFFKNVGKSEITTANAQIDSFGKALDQYRLDNGRYPTTADGLTALVREPAGASGWNGPYLKKDVPKDPWGEPYHYQSPGRRNPDYDLFSYGPDRAPGGDKENADIGNW